MALKTRRPKYGLILPARFWAKVNFRGPRVLNSQCWLWTGANSGGKHPYGVTWDGTRRVKAHRYAAQAYHGAIPDGMQVDHLCKTTLCVRPDHLEIVTQRENVMRSNAPGPRAVRENTCKRGHPFTEENTIRRRDGRECRTCHRAQHRESKRRRRMARKEATN